jgi:hypothetical protein
MPLDLAERCIETRETLRDAGRFIADVVAIKRERDEAEIAKAEAERKDQEWQSRVAEWAGRNSPHGSLIIRPIIKAVATGTTTLLTGSY